LRVLSPSRVRGPHPVTIHVRAALALAGLVTPTAVAVTVAVLVAGQVEPVVDLLLQPAVAAAEQGPPLLAALLAGPYGLLTMVPLLLVWALPAAVALAVVQALGTSSGLLDRLAGQAAPLVRPLGLDGSGLVQLVAGFGCNVPAVLASRRCVACVRRPTVAAIGFGSICSYQLAATVAVLGAAGAPRLLGAYLAAVLVGTIVHTAWTHGRRATMPITSLPIVPALRRPRLDSVVPSTAQTLRHLLRAALPVFLVVTVVASVAQLLGVDAVVARALGPMMLALGLPAAVALPVVLASVRKDGLLLLAAPAIVLTLEPAQLLAALVLAGTLTPCLVTMAAMIRTVGWRTTVPLLGRQAIVASGLTAALAWGSRLLG
jgi:ferrous iron transport protein B